MKISITSSIGQGVTELSAFDNALLKAGIMNNLVYLSSVIPPNSEVIIEKPKILESDFGKRMYVVMAQNRTSKIGNKTSAGIGWIIEKENRFGFFVEHEAESKEQVEILIRNSLHDMMMNRSEYSFSDIQMRTEEATCVNKPVCALCCAIFKVENW